MATDKLDERLRTLANAAAKRFKGRDYEVDPTLPAKALAEIVVRRAAALTRGAARSRFGRRGGTPFLGPGVQLRHVRQLHFGRGVTIGKGAVLDGLSRCGVVIGDNVTIGAYTIIEASGVVTDLGHGCSIGKRSSVGSGSFIGAAGGVWIGDDVIMGNRVNFHSENHVFADVSVPIREQGVTRKGIRIEGDCWVGSGVTFLDGAHVGPGCVIAAGSVVRGSIPAFSVVAGVPAKVIRNRKPEEADEDGVAVGRSWR